MMKKSIVVSIVLVIMLSIVIPAKVMTANRGGNTVLATSSPIWPMFHYNAKRTGQCPYPGIPSPTLLWKYKTGGEVYSSPAIASDGTIYVGSSDHYLYALTPKGALKWKYKTGDGIYSSPAIAPDGTIYVGSYDYYIYAIRSNGTLKWKYKTGGEVYSSPVIAPNGTIYVGSSDDYLYAINPNGTLKWKYKTGYWIESSPAIASDGTIYIGSPDKYLYAINPNGTLKWKYKTGGEIFAAPVIASNGTIYVGANNHYLYAFNPNGTRKWRYKTGGEIDRAAAISYYGTVYVGSFDKYLHAVNPNGTRKWRYKTGGWVIYSTPVIASDGTVYVGSDDHYLYAFTPNGELKWRYKTGDRVRSTPVISRYGTVYVGSDDHYLYAIGCPQIQAPQNFSASSFGTTVTLKWNYPEYNTNYGTLWFEYYEYDVHSGNWTYRGKVKYPTKKVVLNHQSYGRHWYKMRAHIEGYTCYSNYTDDEFVYILQTPQNFSASANGKTVTLKWDYPAYNTNYGALWFECYEYNTSGHTWGYKGHVKYPAKQIVLSNQSNGKHWYKIRAILSAYPCSSEYTASKLVYVLQTPQNFFVSSYGTTVTFKWDYPAYTGSETLWFNYYEYNTQTHKWDYKGHARYPLKKLTITNQPYGKHLYKMRAAVPPYSSYSEYTSQHTCYVLHKPTHLAATALSSTDVKLTFDHVDSNATKIKIYVSNNGTTYNVIPATVSSSLTSITVHYLSPDKDYYFKIAATRNYDSSLPSDPAHVKTPPLQTKPNAPTDLSAVSNSCSEVSLSWTDNSDNEEHFIVERKEAGGTYSVIATLDPDTTTYTDSTVEGNKTYYYRVKAVNGAGDSDYAESSAVNVPKCMSKPDAPTGLSATAISSTEIDLEWTDNSDNEDGFKVERKELGGSYTVIATLPADTTSYKDKGLSYGTTYYYRVRAFNSEGFSNYSNEASATTEPASTEQIIITLQPDNPYMTVNGVQQEIDPGRGTKPVIIPKWSRTVVPIRAIVEALGGTISWDGKERKVTINFNDTVINLWIDNPKAEVNGETKWIDPNNHDVKPIIINSRTMLPLRFVAENLGCKVDWNGATRTITITYPKP